MSGRVLRLVALAAWLLPRAAWACAVCGGGNPANRTAFFGSTIALSLLPLGLFGGAFLWLRKRLGGRAANEFLEREALRPTADVPAADAADAPAADRIHPES